jgi:hypothetical protein
MRWSITLRWSIALLTVLSVVSCGKDLERSSRIAVKSLVAAPENKVEQELAKVVALGRYALPDIEQEFHSAPGQGRLRLLEALRQLALPEAVPFVQTIERWEQDEAVKKQAILVRKMLVAASR